MWHHLIKATTQGYQGTSLVAQVVRHGHGPPQVAGTVLGFFISVSLGCPEAWLPECWEEMARASFHWPCQENEI